MNAVSPESGLRYKDIALLGQMMKTGFDLARPRHTLYYLYFGSREAAEAAAASARDAGYACEVRDPLPQYPNQWLAKCEKPDAVLSADYVRTADALFQNLADQGHGDFDGWEAGPDL